MIVDTRHLAALQEIVSLILLSLETIITISGVENCRGHCNGLFTCHTFLPISMSILLLGWLTPSLMISPQIRRCGMTWQLSSIWTNSWVSLGGVASSHMQIYLTCLNSPSWHSYIFAGKEASKVQALQLSRIKVAPIHSSLFADYSLPVRPKGIREHAMPQERPLTMGGIRNVIISSIIGFSLY